MNTIALLGLAATLALIVALVLLHIARTGLSPVVDPVSAYALTGARTGYIVAAVAAATAGACCAVLLSGIAGAGPTVVLLCVFAGARVIIPFFPMDRQHERRTPGGRLHNLLAIGAFASVTAAAFLAVSPLAMSDRVVLAAASTAAAIIMALGSVGVVTATALPAARRLLGVAERLIYLGFIVWFLVLTIGWL